MPSTTGIITSVVAAGALGYLIYFDYMRRNSKEFRQYLSRRNAKFEKARLEAQDEQQSRQRKEILEAIETSLQNDPLPSSLQGREQVFMSEVSHADELLRGGSSQHMAAALCFYRALLVYPNPTDLLSVYESSIRPEEVLELVRTMVLIRPPQSVDASGEKSQPSLDVE